MPPAALVDGIPKALKAPLNQHRGSIRLLLAGFGPVVIVRSEEHTSELQSPCNLVCRLLLEKKKNPTDAYPCSRRHRRLACAPERSSADRHRPLPRAHYFR